MLFNSLVESQAIDRQSWKDGFGSWCAMCGSGLWKLMPQSVPRVPVSKGGDKKEGNCVVVCNKCFSEMDNPGKEVISWEAIPYYNSAPPDWRERSRRPL